MAVEEVPSRAPGGDRQGGDDQGGEREVEEGEGVFSGLEGVGDFLARLGGAHGGLCVTYWASNLLLSVTLLVAVFAATQTYMIFSIST